MKIAVILGTRPEIIKMAPVIKELERKKADFFILHTGQHYSYELDEVFFEQLTLPRPEYNLDVGSGSHGEATGKMLIGIEKTLKEAKPDAVLVEGDTNSILAGALAAAKLGIRVGHVEAGLRSYDRTMPEEINRVLTDHISDYLFAPTPQAREILRGEGIPGEKIFITGNTIVDAVNQNLELSRSKADILDSLGLKPDGYFLVTLHRQENVDSRARFASILEGLKRVAAEFNMPVFYPVHPRSKKMMAEFGLGPGNIVLAEPVDFLAFLQLESRARLILTDSGGVQEEACILKVPCVTLRDNTERPETVAVGANIIAGSKAENIVRAVREMLKRERDWDNPFGDGRAAERVVATLEGKL
ncbi:MAG TPA: UDP-N-acetylglucosamine 2-epimerase (non-hydrolyzing) [Dehalococcoidales bacterium]|nr:MAG: UDP-N-acetylglucosamine 2-epimerase [Chloroflexi bacterium RBG_16_60_22]HJX12040.1 UDP-N-acetylglucosamine 2-epimerase (non-hydrolyzing) [Dehalococcoidales bacterium]